MYRLGKHLAIWGSVLQLGLLAGPVVTVVSMIRTFTDVAHSGSTGPDNLASGISLALKGTVVGLTVSVIGFVAISIAVLVCEYRTPWLHSVLSFQFPSFWFSGMPQKVLRQALQHTVVLPPHIAFL